MGLPILVEVVASDPVLQAGVEGALRRCAEVAVATGSRSAEVSVVVVDAVDEEAIRAVRAAGRYGRRGVVLLATSLGIPDVVRAIEAGVSGVVRRRDASPQRLLVAIRGVANGEAVMPRDLLDELVERVERLRRTLLGRGRVLMLDDREKAVLRMLGDGHETAEIARSLAYSQRTVTAVVHQITHRLQLRNRAHAVAYALREGLI